MRPHLCLRRLSFVCLFEYGSLSQEQVGTAVFTGVGRVVQRGGVRKDVVLETSGRLNSGLVSWQPNC